MGLIMPLIGLGVSPLDTLVYINYITYRKLKIYVTISYKLMKYTYLCVQTDFFSKNFVIIE